MSKTLVIAEAGVNHDGCPGKAHDLIDVAKASGADIVKFQTFVPEEVVAGHAAKADYQKALTGDSESQLEMVRKLRLGADDHRSLADHCRRVGIEFLSTPFDAPSLRFLVEVLGLSRLKLASGEITNAPLLHEAGRTGRDIILSTGMSTLEEVRRGLGYLALGYLGGKPSRKNAEDAYQSPEGRAALAEHVALMHAVTEYPAPAQETNLRAMDTLRGAFGLSVGLSDHSLGITIPIAGVARGARIIEKHFTLDRTSSGPDHAASLEPRDLAAMVDAIRIVEMALGDGEKRPQPSEIKNISVARKSLVARRLIVKGEIFTEENLTVKRPGSGISAAFYWDLLGTRARYAYDADALIRPDELQ